MRIGILTGGGDVPGLNPCIRSITLSADDLGWEAVGFRRGWEGVLAIDPADPASIAANSLHYIFLVNFRFIHSLFKWFAVVHNN